VSSVWLQVRCIMMAASSGGPPVGTWRAADACHCVRWVKWPDVRDQVETVSADLASNLDEFLSAVPNLSLPLLEYQYGDPIIEGGVFRPPCDSRGCRDCGAVHELSAYSSVPLSLVLQGCAEIYLDCKWDFEDGRLSPLSVLNKGEMYGVFETLDHLLGLPARRIVWSVCSGIRSVWVIAPLGNTALLAQLLQGRMRWNDHEPHWQLIKAATAGTSWRTRVLLFPREAIEALNGGRGENFRRALLQVGWTQSAGHRHIAVEDAELHEELHRRFKHISPVLGELYHFATIKHWISVVRGDRPAFQASHRFAEPGGPFDEFVQALSAGQERAKLKSLYQPVVLRPGLLRSGESGYYSFRCPSLLGPRMPEVRTYAQLPFDFVDLLQGVQEHWANSLKPPHVQYYLQPPRISSDKIRVLNSSISYANQLPRQELSPNGSSRELYWSSPFFVSGVRLSRAA